jgi:hypothetical protein
MSNTATRPARTWHEQISDRDASGAPPVDISAALAVDLTALTDALDDPRTDLGTQLGSFVDDVRSAVGSYLGLSMTTVVDGHAVTLDLIEDLGDSSGLAASLLLPLPAIADAEPGSVLLLYAAKAGAFVDLAADLTWALGLDPAALILDEHLTAPAEVSALSGLQELSIINQAVGVLIDRGHTPQAARDELHQHASNEGRSPYASAERLVHGLTSRPVADEE